MNNSAALLKLACLHHSRYLRNFLSSLSESRTFFTVQTTDIHSNMDDLSLSFPTFKVHVKMLVAKLIKTILIYFRVSSVMTLKSVSFHQMSHSFLLSLPHFQNFLEGVFLRCNTQSSKSIHRVICEQIKVRVSGPSHLSLVLLRIPHKVLLSQRWRVE